MTFPFTLVFLALLAAYAVYSVWADLDPRYPVGAALVLLAAAAVTDAAGATGAANALAEYVFFLLAAGVVLLLVDPVRRGRPVGPPTSAGAEPAVVPTAEPADERQGPSDQRLDRADE